MSDQLQNFIFIKEEPNDIFETVDKEQIEKNSKSVKQEKIHAGSNFTFLNVVKSEGPSNGNENCLKLEKETVNCGIFGIVNEEIEPNEHFYDKWQKFEEGTVSNTEELSLIEAEKTNSKIENKIRSTSVDTKVLRQENTASQESFTCLHCNQTFDCIQQLNEHKIIHKGARAVIMSDEELINNVYLYEILYNISHKNYYDVVRKENAWEEIAKNLNFPVSDVKKRWTSLRDCYRKALNRKKTTSGQKAVEIIPWRYEKQMSFLKAHFSKKRPQLSNLAAEGCHNTQTFIKEENTAKKSHEERTSCVAEESSTEMLEFESASVHGKEHLSSQEIPKPIEMSTPPTKKKKTSHATAGSSSAHAILTTYLEKKNSKQDHLTSYFKGVEDTVRTFTPLLQIEIKSRISALVSEFEYRNAGCMPSSFITTPYPSTVSENEKSGETSFSTLIS